MLKFIIALTVVVAFVAGGFIAFRRNAPPLPSQDVLDRVKAREQDIQTQERAEGKD